jgi:RNA polymerase sigma factor (TIGR02999 family)
MEGDGSRPVQQEVVGRREVVHELLEEVRGGSAQAFDALFELLYEELQALAHRQRVAWRGNPTLNTTALVHEVYLKLGGRSDPEWENRAHFLAAASRAIRHILINYAREQTRLKRGDGKPLFSLDQIKDVPGEPFVLTEEHVTSLLTLNRALNRLEQNNARQSRIVECRFFGDMTIQETAAALGISAASVNRGWKYAQVWLYREMEREP